MKRNLLVSAAAVVCLAWPIAVFADPPSDQGQSQQHGQDKGQGQSDGQKGAQGKAPTQGGGAGQGQAGHQSQGAAAFGRAQVGPQGGAQVGSAGQGQAGRKPQVHAAGRQAQFSTQGAGQGQVGQQPQHHTWGAQPYLGTQGGRTGAPASTTGQVARPATTHFAQVGSRPPANVAVLTGWNRGLSGPAQVQAGQQWRQQHNGWSNNAVWRRNANWWQGNGAFRLWGGARFGYFFIPELGYVSVPVAYRAHYWRAGDMLPSWFWRFEVRDYWTYGLPQPPDGCAWVWVDNDVALIDLSDGYILDIEHNVW